MSRRPPHVQPGEGPHVDPFCARCRRPVRLAGQPAAPEHASAARVWVVSRRWPEGWICSGCYARACETYGVCAGCGADRLLPGIGPDQKRVCTDCAGGLGDFTCTRCGQEGWRHLAGICGRCVLTDRLAQALDDGTGRVRPELVPLFDQVRAMSRPRSGILWLTKPHVPPILRAIAHGEVPLTHEGLSTLTPWRSVIYVRDLLISCGVLPPIDRFLFLFEQWLPGWLEEVPDDEHRKILHRFATWHLLRRLRSAAATAPVGHYRSQLARAHLRQAAAFLLYLSSRATTLAECTQADLDHWHAHAPRTQRQTLRPFLRWALRARQTPALKVPPIPTKAPAPISQQQRVQLIRRIHSGQGIDLADRILALLILLYAQPLTRIARLKIDDVIRDGDHTLLRLGDPPVPVPAPFDDLLTTYVASRSNLTTATNRDSRWLFPGRRADQPLHPTSMRLRLQRLEIPNLNGRSRAIRELLLQAPPAVVARMLGYDTQHAEQLAIEAGTTWTRYATGDHATTRIPRRS